MIDRRDPRIRREIAKQMSQRVEATKTKTRKDDVRHGTSRSKRQSDQPHCLPPRTGPIPCNSRSDLRRYVVLHRLLLRTAMETL